MWRFMARDLKRSAHLAGHPANLDRLGSDLMIVHDLHLRVINATTGELLRELTLDPSRDYQPTGRPPGPPPKTPRP
jgi:hypothetical protein